MVKSSAPRRNKSLQKSLQNNKFEGWPSGPWLDDDGKLNGDFVDWVTKKFMADPRRGSDDFYGTQAKVLHYFRSNETAIQNNWLIYHKQHLHLLATATITHSSGGINKEKTLNELVKAKPAICNPGPQDITYRAPECVHEYNPALAEAAERAVNSNNPLPLLNASSIETVVLAGQLEEAPVEVPVEVSVEVPSEEVFAEEISSGADYPPIEDPWLDSADSAEPLEKQLKQEESQQQEEAMPTNQTSNHKGQEAVVRQKLLEKLGCLSIMWKANDFCRRLVKDSVAKDQRFVLTDDGPALAPGIQNTD